MLETEELLLKLRKMDLSDLEVKLYLTLLAYGTLTAVQAADRSGVPRPRAYDELASLERKGLILRAPAKPIKYRAVSPQESIQRLASRTSKEYSEKMDELSRNADDLIESLQPLFNKTAAGPSDIAWIVVSVRNIKNELRTMLSKTKKQFFVSYAPGLDFFHRLRGIDSTLEKLRNNGVNFMPLLDLSVPAISHGRKFRKILGKKTRFCKRPFEPLGVYARDGEQVLIAYQSNPTSSTYDVALNLVESPLATMLFDVFVQPWKQGISLTEARKQLKKKIGRKNEQEHGFGNKKIKLNFFQDVLYFSTIFFVSLALSIREVTFSMSRGL